MKFLVFRSGVDSRHAGYPREKKEGKKEREKKRLELVIRAVYPPREPWPLSDLSVCHFIVGASCSVIYPIAP